MAFSSGFFNSKGLDRTYTAENFCDYLGSIICNGIQDNYGDCFKLTAASSGLKVTVGRGKAWINGHYFINDARYSIDLTEFMDESLPRYVGIAIYLDTTESVRSVTLKLFPGTPAETHTGDRPAESTPSPATAAQVGWRAFPPGYSETSR